MTIKELLEQVLPETNSGDADKMNTSDYIKLMLELLKGGNREQS